MIFINNSENSVIQILANRTWQTTVDTIYTDNMQYLFTFIQQALIKQIQLCAQVEL